MVDIPGGTEQDGGTPLTVPASKADIAQIGARLAELQDHVEALKVIATAPPVAGQAELEAVRRELSKAAVVAGLAVVIVDVVATVASPPSTPLELVVRGVVGAAAFLFAWGTLRFADRQSLPVSSIERIDIARAQASAERRRGGKGETPATQLLEAAGKFVESAGKATESVVRTAKGTKGADE